jgi:hypothetical protein
MNYEGPLSKFLHSLETKTSKIAEWKHTCLESLSNFLSTKTPALASKILPFETSFLSPTSDLQIIDNALAQYRNQEPVSSLLKKYTDPILCFDVHQCGPRHFKRGGCMEKLASMIVDRYRSISNLKSITGHLKIGWKSFLPPYLDPTDQVMSQKRVNQGGKESCRFINSLVSDQFYCAARLGSWIHVAVNAQRIFRHQVVSRRLYLTCPSFSIDTCFEDALTLYRSFISFDFEEELGSVSPCMYILYLVICD